LGGGRFPAPDGRARFVPVRQAGVADATCAERPLVLNTGRLRDHWHTMTRTGRVPRLSSNAPEPFVELNAADAARHGLADGDLVCMSSRYGSARAKVRISDAQQPGHAFLPMHWSGHFAANAGAGPLATPANDAVSGQPELKHVPIRISREAVAWSGVLVTRRDLRPTGFVHWSRHAVDGGWVYELCGTETPDQGVLLSRSLIEPMRLGDLMEYTDRRGLNYRAAVLDGTGALAEALLVAPPRQLPARDWLVTLLGSRRLLSPGERMALLSGRSPTPTPAVGRIVCACFNVGANQIAASGCSTVEKVGATLRAGTNCGSCRSEIRKLLDEARLQAAE
jgi:assimilatory nitrate reductase catalytic subunit